MGNNQIEAISLNTRILKEIDLFLENYYASQKTINAGREMKNSKMKKNQVRGLENLIVSTTRFSEIINYIKNQTGKNRGEWRSVGPLLLSQLADIESAAIEIAGEDTSTRLEAKLKLVNGWARQVVAHYLYESGNEGGIS
jgi:hypothetical protein